MSVHLPRATRVNPAELAAARALVSVAAGGTA